MNKKLKETLKEAAYVFVLPSLSGGGAERVISLLASELVNEGYSVHVILYYKVEKEYEINKKVIVHYVEPCFMENRGVYDKIRKLLRVRNIVKKVGKAYVIPFLPGCVIHTYFAVRGLQHVRFIATIRNNPEYVDDRFRNRNDWCICHADALWAQNVTQQKYYERRGQTRGFVLENPVNPVALMQEHAYKKQLLHFVAVGRLSEQKNYKLMIQAFSKVHKEMTEATLTIFGEGNLREAIERQIKVEELEGSVILKGRTEQVFTEINLQDIYILSSDYEGMPNSLMEAMAEGMPCIATNCPTGPAELLADGRGELVPCRDANLLAERMLWLSVHPEEAKKMGIRAKNYMEKHYSLPYISSELVRHCGTVGK